MPLAVEIAGVVISGVALCVAAASAAFARRQVHLGERQRARDFEATVVAELVELRQAAGALRYELAVTNAGPAVARDVDVSLVEWRDSPLGRLLAEAAVAPALLRGERRQVVLNLPQAEARLDDRSVSIELHADYYDDNGIRNERLALACGGTLILTPPQP